MRTTRWIPLLVGVAACEGGKSPRDAMPLDDTVVLTDAESPDGNELVDAALDAPTATCLDGTYDVEDTWPATSGSLAIAGTIMLPATLPSGRTVQLETVQVSPSTGNALQPKVLTSDKSALTYRTKGLPDGTWKICLRADVDGNGNVGEAGIDYVGCYAGTVMSPIKTSANATPITLGGQCKSMTDFGVNVQ